MKRYIWVCALFISMMFVQNADAENYLTGYGASGSTHLSKDNGGGGYNRLSVGSGRSGPSIVGGNAFAIHRPHGDQSWKYKKKEPKVIQRHFRAGTPLIYRVTPAGNLAPRGYVQPVSLQK